MQHKDEWRKTNRPKVTRLLRTFNGKKMGFIILDANGQENRSIPAQPRQKNFFLKQMGWRDPQPMCKVRDLEHSILDGVSLSNPSPSGIRKL